jgi:hypothetical protein
MRRSLWLAPPLLAALALLPLAAGATKPCLPESTRRQHATWVAVGKVLERHERIVPYPNCALEDRSRCSPWDVSLLVVEVERYERGDGPRELRLVPELCAPAPPRETGRRYRFFGTGTSSYVDMEPVVGHPR